MAVFFCVFLVSSALALPQTQNSTALLEEAEASFMDFTDGEWKFSLDPQNHGEIQGFAQDNFDDSSWPKIAAGETWEKQGYPTYDGYAWYRRKVMIPWYWQGSKVRFETDGVGDEYDVFINGQFVEHKGGFDFGSVYLWPTFAELGSFLRYGEENTLAIRVWDRAWYYGGGLWRRAALRRIVDLAERREEFPEPILDSHPEWLELYWKTWDLAWEKISFGSPQNGFVKRFLEEGFNEQIFQWDTSFMAFFARYANKTLPGMESLDNFYLKQREDGYIQRSYSATTGEMVEIPTASEPAVNPPLFVWVENSYAEMSGDLSRLPRVLPKLEKYYLWIKNNMRGPLGQGLYFNTQVASGMDNAPRGDSLEAGWVDMSMQQALAARNLSAIAEKVGDRRKRLFWLNEYQSLRQLIVDKMWDERDRLFYDVQRSGEVARKKHIGIFWALISGVADFKQAEGLYASLKNSEEFYTENLFPTLAKSDPEFNEHGGYWLGSVWAPTNYMVIKGLQNYSTQDPKFLALANEAARNYLRLMSEVYKKDLDPAMVNYLDRIPGSLHTLWECYAPRSDFPCSPGNGSFARANFVGWTGVGPVALLIENILGLNFNGYRKLLRWELQEEGRVGLQNFWWGRSGRYSVLAQATAENGERVVEVEAARRFTLEINWRNKKYTFSVLPGRHQFRLN